jgi:DNA-binding winged helix-turn-helix (wHTH) protein
MQQLSILQRSATQPGLYWDRPRVSRHEASASGDVVLRFGRFCVLPRARRLLVDAQPVEIGSRAFDLMIVLIGAAGALVTKNELLGRVWPDTVVAEDNLKVQMSALRKVLNEDRDIIKTVHGRGYVFTGAVTATSVETHAIPSPDARSTWPLLGPGLSPDRSPRPIVVVIDDDPDVRAALQGLLRSAGLDVASFAAVQEFLDSPPKRRESETKQTPSEGQGRSSAQVCMLEK